MVVRRDSESDITNSESHSLQSTTGKRKRSEMIGEKKRKKSASSEESIIIFLENMYKDMKEGQKEVLDQLKRQHEHKMKTEDAKINLMSKLVDREIIILIYKICVFLDNLIHVQINS